MKLLKKTIKLIFYPFSFSFGYLSFLFSKKTMPQAYASLRFYFVLTNGKSNNIASKLISSLIPKYKVFQSSGILGNLSESDVDTIVSEIRNKGYYVFDKKLDATTVGSLTEFATTTKVSYLDVSQKHIRYSKEKVLFNENDVISPRYQFQNDQLFSNETVKDIVFDGNLLAIANSYLKTKPIVDIVTMWWSLPFDSKAEVKAAQRYHFDMDRFKFIKFFFYLNDVTSDNGPHCYIRNSHKRIPRKILTDRRLLDSEINEFYPPEDVLELTGSRGSIIAVDTRGLHKGKPLIKGKRLLFQIQFSNSLFGAPYTKVDNVLLAHDHLDKKRKFDRAYQLVN